MELLLWRHCDAAPGGPDDARPLTPLGRKQAQAMGRWLAAKIPAESRIVVSPAARAQQTASALGRSFVTTGDVGTGTSVDALLDAVQWPDAATVLVVGHQPALGRVVSRLVDGDDADRVLAPGAVCWLTAARGGGASIHALVTPGTVAASP